MRTTVVAQPGQDTLLGSWAALAQLSPGARLIRSSTVVAAMFPSWAALNNAIMLARPDCTTTASAAAHLVPVYAEAGVDAWALWVPSRATDLEAADTVAEVGGMKRDATTLVMQATLRRGLRRCGSVVRTSIATATHATDEPVSARDIGEPEAVPNLDGWVLVHDRVAVAGAWSFLHDSDCGIYAVGTVPLWRRQGFARALVEHVLAHAQLRGARTASLQSTRMGQPLYESLGFQVAGRYEEWASTASMATAAPRAADHDAF
jgi:ribosomal protein S18 acetylase RimI-like enzyme